MMALNPGWEKGGGGGARGGDGSPWMENVQRKKTFSGDQPCREILH